jgi:hypothetical protein
MSASCAAPAIPSVPEFEPPVPLRLIGHIGPAVWSEQGGHCGYDPTRPLPPESFFLPGEYLPRHRPPADADRFLLPAHPVVRHCDDCECPGEDSCVCLCCCPPDQATTIHPAAGREMATVIHEALEAEARGEMVDLGSFARFTDDEEDPEPAPLGELDRSTEDALTAFNGAHDAEDAEHPLPDLPGETEVFTAILPAIPAADDPEMTP